MRSSNLTLGAVLNSPNQYVIPVFQHHYRWDQPEWEKLWDDLAELQQPGRTGRHFNVRHVRRRRGAADRLQLVERAGRLDEAGVGPRGAGRLHPRDRLVQALDGQGVGAGDDEEVAAAARLDRRADLLHVVVAADDPLAPHVAAPLGPGLVLQEAAGGAGGDQLGDGSVDVQRVAVAGVR